jgi:hypothetical protein
VSGAGITPAKTLEAETGMMAHAKAKHLMSILLNPDCTAVNAIYSIMSLIELKYNNLEISLVDAGQSQ